MQPCALGLEIAQIVEFVPEIKGYNRGTLQIYCATSKINKIMTQRVFTQTFGVVGAMIEKDGKFLLVKEKKLSAKDKWNHPAGWIDLEEDTIDAVKREVKEETGFDFEPKNILGVYVLVKKELSDLHHAIKIIFIGDIAQNQGEYMIDEISETKWFTPEEIEAMDLSTLRDKDIKTMVKDYLAGKKYPLEIITHTIQK